MTRDEQITTILELMAPPCADRDACWREIELMLKYVDRRCTSVAPFKFAVSKRGKARLQRYLAALKSVNAAYDNLDGVRPWFSLSETAYIVGSPTVMDREIAKVAVFLAWKTKPKPDALRAKEAVAATHQMLPRWGHKASVTSGGIWVKVAQAFAGNGISRAAVFRHIRAYNKRRRPAN